MYKFAEILMYVMGIISAFGEISRQNYIALMWTFVALVFVYMTHRYRDENERHFHFIMSLVERVDKVDLDEKKHE